MQHLGADKTADLKPVSNTLACHDCDLLLHDKQRESNRKACCPRCGALLHITKLNSTERTLALSLTGLLLFIPANSLPLLTLELLGQVNSSTIITGVIRMFEGGYWWMSLLVAFCSIIAPLAKLMMLFYLSISMHFNNMTRRFVICLKFYQKLDEWGMFDVYMLGLLVSFIKMKELGSLSPGLGLWCFLALMLIATASSSVFDRHQAWLSVSASQQRRENGH